MQNALADANAWRSLALQPLEGAQGAAPRASRTGQRARLRAGLAIESAKEARSSAVQAVPCAREGGGAARGGASDTGWAPAGTAEPVGRPSGGPYLAYSDRCPSYS